MKNKIKQILETDNAIAPLLLRLPVGVIFMAHGAQKLFGSFGGSGLEGFAGWLGSMGIEPSMMMAMLAGGSEFFGGLLLIIGLLVRPAALTLVVTMLVAIFAVHIDNGLFISNKGYEFALALLSVSASLLVSGGGRFSIDGKVGATK